MQYPRIIIIGENFRLSGGGGITLTNLFKDWPPENIGVATDMINLTNPSTAYTYYQMGQKEIKFPFPFFIFQTYFKSGPYSFNHEGSRELANEVKNNWFLKFKKIIRPAFDNFLNRIGLYSSFYNIRLSEDLKSWIKAFNPDLIYIQPFYHHVMHFGNLLFNELKIPYAIHIMDDSVTYINRSIFFKQALQRRINSDFRILVENAQVRMCISEEMANEYHARYGKSFSHFRNPIEVDRWVTNHNNVIQRNDEELKIIYTGRTYPPYFDSLVDVCKVVDRLNRKDKTISLSISSIDINPAFQKIIKDLKGIRFYPIVDFKEIPQMISQYNLFLICEDFNTEAQRYLHFSISTRASEGMISGIPVLIYAPEESALCRYFSKTNSGSIVGGRDILKLEEEIMKLWNDRDYCKILSENAIRTARADSDSVIVREEFRKALSLIHGDDAKS